VYPSRGEFEMKNYMTRSANNCTADGRTTRVIAMRSAAGDERTVPFSSQRFFANAFSAIHPSYICYKSTNVQQTPSERVKWDTEDNILCYEIRLYRELRDDESLLLKYTRMHVEHTIVYI